MDISMEDTGVLSKRSWEYHVDSQKRLRMYQDVDMAMDCHSGNGRQQLRLVDLPVHVLKKIVSYVALGEGEEDGHDKGQTLLGIHGFRNASALLLTCRTLAYAFYEHVTEMSLTDISFEKLQQGLIGILPKFSALTCLRLSIHNIDWRLIDQWQEFFLKSQARIRILRISITGTFGPLYDPVIKIISKGCGLSLEMFELISVALDGSNILATIGEYCNNITGLRFRCNGIDLRVLANFPRLQYLEAALFRVSADDIRKMNWALSLARDLRIVRLRFHEADFGNELDILCNIPQLHKLSLFGCRFQGSVSALAGARFLNELQFEWMTNITDNDIDELARRMGANLLKLVLRNCPRLSDISLLSIAHNCPKVELDLSLDNGQFSEGAVDLFRNRGMMSIR